MDILKDKLPIKDTRDKTEISPEGIAPKLPLKDYGGDTKRQASAVVFPFVAALAVTALLLSAEPTCSFLSGLLSGTAGEYARRYTSVPASVKAVFRQAIALADPSLLFFGLMLPSPLSVVYRPLSAVLLLLRVLLLSLGAGTVLMCEASLFGKVAVLIAFTVDALSSAYAASSAVSAGDAIVKKLAYSGKHPFFRHTLKLIFAHGASVFIRFLLLTVGAFIL